MQLCEKQPANRSSAKSMCSRRYNLRPVILVSLVFGMGLPLIGLSTTPAAAEAVPFNCYILPDENDVASINVTNSLASNASCIVSCKFATVRDSNNPQIICAKPVPAGTAMEMCRLPSGGDKMVKLIEGHAECTK
jgi:hypothetical protein